MHPGIPCCYNKFNTFLYLFLFNTLLWNYCFVDITGDKNRIFSFQQLLDLSLPFSEVSFEGDVCVAKANETGGMLNYATCAEQLLYEVGDPGGYITPDVVRHLCEICYRLSVIYCMWMY